MLQKKNGFTLVEIIVVIAISAIVLTMVGTSMVFVANTSGDLLQEAEDIDMAKNIEKYLRNLVKEDEVVVTNLQNIVNLDDSNNIVRDSKTIFSDTGLTNFEIKEESGFIKCYMKFDSEKEFEFIIGIVPETVIEGE